MYQVFLHLIYWFSLINNITVDHEKLLRMRFFWDWSQRNKNEQWVERLWIWLYGLDIDTQQDVCKGLIIKDKIIKIEIDRYLTKGKDEKEYWVKEKYLELFRVQNKRKEYMEILKKILRNYLMLLC